MTSRFCFGTFGILNFWRHDRNQKFFDRKLFGLFVGQAKTGSLQKVTYKENRDHTQKMIITKSGGRHTAG